MGKETYADVLVLGVGDPYNPRLTYKASSELLVGSVVEVPYGKRGVVALVIELHNRTPSFETKLVGEKVYSLCIPLHLISLAKWMSEYYHEPIQRCVESVLICKKRMKRTKRYQYRDAKQTTRELDLHDEQKFAKDEIIASLGHFKGFLLHGITGSGKTEVYLSAMKEVLAQGKSVIYLVPEIALTPQTVARVRDRLGDCIRVMTSQLSDGERCSLFEDIREKRCRVVVGSRSALFAPFDDLGLVVIDECHDGSYKQDASPHYNAATIAEKLCMDIGIPLVLGSATPKVTQYYHTEGNGEIGTNFRLLSLTSRAGNAAVPLVTIADMREELKKRNFTSVSNALEKALEETLLREEQAVLFINRRGFAHALVCRACGWRAMCPNCSVALVYHREFFGLNNVLVCHQCEFTDVLKASCPQCNSLYIKPLGSGTERIVEDVQKIFSKARLCRMDRDTTSKKGSHEELYNSFLKREYDILIGTQMVTKGWDMPHVTCVGIMNADSMLHMSFYNAAEQAYALMTQVAGRAGRSKERPGNAVIQTYSPEHYAVTHTVSHDYHGFYQQELMYRRMLRYPPFSCMAELTISHAKHEIAKKKSEETANLLRDKITLVTKNGKLGGNCELLGPIHAPILRVKEVYYYQILLKGDKGVIDKVLDFVPKDWSVNVEV